MDFHQQKIKEANALYKEHELTIEKLDAALRREIPFLVQEYQLSLTQVKAVEAFVNDKLTLFRYLRKNKFSLPVALSLLLDTLRWRLEEGVDELTLYQVQDLLSAPLCFFHQYDRCGRPVLVIQLCHFPTFKDNTELLDSIVPLVVFVLETGRQLLLHLTEQRMQQNHPNPILADFVILVDFKNANGLPKDFTLVQTFIKLLKRYPGSAGMVCLLNFGWMYQGMWQMIKMILSEEAKNRVAFPKLKDLKEIIDEDCLLTELGGTDVFEWDINHDTLFKQFQYNDTLDEKVKSLVSSRRSSSSSLYQDSMDVFISAPGTPSSRRRRSLAPLTKLSESPSATTYPVPLSYSRRPSASSLSLYATPTGSLTPIPTNQQYHHTLTSHKSTTLGMQGKSNDERKSGGVGGGLRSGLQRLLGHDRSTSGISSWMLSQKLMALQQQQQQLEEDGEKRQQLSTGTKSWLKVCFRQLVSSEKNVAVFLLRHRYWIYAFMFLWILRKKFHLLRLLVARNQNQSSFLISIVAPFIVKHQGSQVLNQY